MEISDRLDGPSSGIEHQPLGAEVNPLQATQLDVVTKTSSPLLLSLTPSYTPFQDNAISCHGLKPGT
ncbi:hypothetical protein Oscil6304_0336 [Oscillatoria acuminata PCC 6304]|uniref:Uncharacterized protein n=1 Tax=Oscillatoria acuminata PCC 6304 TaxID=56110 RepID=K9TB16_9CYAN|nr:hypothetical protein Oscil6304_0336 [Oscillatoria acuminata PCC 6304]